MQLNPDLNDLQPGALAEDTGLVLGHETMAAPRRWWPRLQPALWLGLRLVLGLVGLYFLADELTWLATILAIHLVGSWPERTGLGLILGLALAACFGLAGRLSPRWRYPVALTAVFVVCLLLFLALPDTAPLPFSLFLIFILILNLAPARGWAVLWSRRWARWAADLIFIIGIGWAEILFLKPFTAWWLMRWQGSPEALEGTIHSAPPERRINSALQSKDSRLSWLPGVLLVALLGALLPSAYSLAMLHRALFPDPAVQMFAQGNFNGLELNLEQHTLYAAGYGTNHLLAYDLVAPAQPPRQSPVESDYAQGFGYNPVAQELYVYNQQRQELLFLDAATLDLKKAVAVPQLSPGDAWVIWDSFSDHIFIASEADEPQGFPFIVLDRQSGEMAGTLDIAPGFILPHPTKPLFYMTISFFQENSDLIVYDTIRQQVVLRRPAPAHLDRLAFAMTEGELELLAPSALGAEILRFDPETLEQKGAIASLFGARAIAVDPVRRMVLVGSLVTNQLEVINLDTQERLAVYYIGPWLRSLSLDIEAGQAYLSSHEGLFRIQYAEETSEVSDRRGF